jgi:uncharacterized LabA/DUF88 family protein
MISTTMMFADGENLVFRYQEMLAAGRVPRPSTIHIPDCFVWNEGVFGRFVWSIKRLSYYTSVVGDDLLVTSIREKIGRMRWQCCEDRTRTTERHRSGQIIPVVRKKSGKSRKESICDIAIAVDVLRACYRDHADSIWIFSGDGDFIKLIEEAAHAGKKVNVSAFSSGLSSELKYAVDNFYLLDDVFFMTEEELDA